MRRRAGRGRLRTAQTRESGFVESGSFTSGDSRRFWWFEEDIMVGTDWTSDRALRAVAARGGFTGFMRGLCLMLAAMALVGWAASARAVDGTYTNPASGGS